jgi:hypothetical protein
LTVTNLGPALVAGDTFQLFNQPVSGFVTLNLPDVSPNVWVNLLTSNGTIYVLSTSATNLAIQLTNGILNLSWPSDHIGWRLQMQTNDTTQGLGTNWFDVIGAAATNQWVVPVDPTSGSVFYRMIYP